MLTLEQSTQLKAQIGQLVDAVTQSPEPPTPPPPPPSGDRTLGPGTIEFAELIVPEGQTWTIAPGTKLVRQDVPPDPQQADGGILVMGTLVAIRKDHDLPITIRSANPTGHRGHLMIRGDAQLDGVGIRDFGRTTIDLLDPATNPIGRYAVHFHMAGDRPDSFVRNCVIQDTVSPSIYRHGLVLHATHQVTVQGNVICEKGGTGVFCEDGSEHDNLIQNNVIRYIRNKHGLQSHTVAPPRPVDRGINLNDFGFEGSAVWLRGTRNIVRNNLIDHCAIGIELYCEGSPTQYDAINVIDGNVVEDCHDGYQPWMVGVEGGVRPNPRVTLEPSIVSGFTIRRCMRGMFLYQQGLVSTRNCIVEDCKLVGVIAGGDYRQVGCDLIGCTVRRCGDGVRTPIFVERGFVIEYLVAQDNGCDVATRTLTHNNNAALLPPRRITLRSCALKSHVEIEMRPPERSNEIDNFTQLDQTFVEDYQGVAGDNFRVYFLEQAADHVLPASSVDGRTVGAPEPGLTNQQAFDRYGICWGGEIAPCTARVDGIRGFVCPTS